MRPSVLVSSYWSPQSSLRDRLHHGRPEEKNKNEDVIWKAGNKLDGWRGRVDKKEATEDIRRTGKL